MAGVGYAPDGIARSGMGADFRDVNNDGLPDIWHTAVEHEEFPLWINQGKGEFQDMTVASGLAKTNDMSGWGNGIADFDNDGWKDLFVARANVMDNISIQTPSQKISRAEHNFPESGQWQICGCQRDRWSGFSDRSGTSRRSLRRSGQRWPRRHGCLCAEWPRGAISQHHRKWQSLDLAEAGGNKKQSHGHWRPDRHHDRRWQEAME